MFFLGIFIREHRQEDNISLKKKMRNDFGKRIAFNKSMLTFLNTEIDFWLKTFFFPRTGIQIEKQRLQNSNICFCFLFCFGLAKWSHFSCTCAFMIGWHALRLKP